MKIWLDGRPSDHDALYNRGLLYGDGLFETMAVHTGRPLLLHRHIARVERGCRRLGMAFPGQERVAHEVCEACKGEQRGVLKLLFCRAFKGGGGYAPDPAAATVRILTLHPWRELHRDRLETGIALRTSTVRLGTQPWLAGIKHLNRLEQVLAAAEIPADEEGLMLDRDGRVVEGIRSNLFVLEQGRLCTPPLHTCGVAGVMRETILDMAAGHGLRPILTTMLPAQLPAAEEVFVTNSLIGVLPVAAVDGQACQRGRFWVDLRRALSEAGAIMPGCPA